MLFKKIKKLNLILCLVVCFSFVSNFAFAGSDLDRALSPDVKPVNTKDDYGYYQNYYENISKNDKSNSSNNNDNSYKFVNNFVDAVSNNNVSEIKYYLQKGENEIVKYFRAYHNKYEDLKHPKTKAYYFIAKGNFIVGRRETAYKYYSSAISFLNNIQNPDQELKASLLRERAFCVFTMRNSDSFEDYNVKKAFPIGINKSYDANDLTEREEEPDEPELMFTCENGPRVYYDLANFLTEFADGNFFTSDKISNVEVYGKAQNLRLNITSMFELACILDVEDKYHFRGTASSYSCDPTGSHVMHDKSYYLDKFKDKYAKKEEKNTAWQENVVYDPFSAQERFDEECNAEEIVGYYIYYYEDDALKTWRENIEGRVITDEIREVTRILEYLYTSEPYAISPQTALSVLAANMPMDYSEFDYQDENAHYVALPFDRRLRIVYDENSEKYLWLIDYSQREIDAIMSDNERGIETPNADDFVMCEDVSDDFCYDTVYCMLDWAIRIASETPMYEAAKPKFRVGDEVRYTKTDEFCYVV